MSVFTTADEKRDLLNNKLDELKSLIDEIQQVTLEMFDKNTWGSGAWSKAFRQDTERLSDHLYFMRKDIVDYDNEWRS